MTCRLIDFALVVLYLMMFKVGGIIGISKIEFFNFSSIERVKQNQKNLKTIRNLLSFLYNHFSSSFNKNQTYFWFFTEKLTPLLPVTTLYNIFAAIRCAGHNTDLQTTIS